MLADPVACEMAGERISAGTSKGLGYVDVRHGTRKTRYSETDAYGYSSCGDRDIRIASGGQYFILETRRIQVLRVDQWVMSGKTLVASPAFYFSVGASGAIQPLTLENVKRAFPENHAFTTSLTRCSLVAETRLGSIGSMECSRSIICSTRPGFRAEGGITLRCA